MSVYKLKLQFIFILFIDLLLKVVLFLISFLLLIDSVWKVNLLTYPNVYFTNFSRRVKNNTKYTV